MPPPSTSSSASTSTSAAAANATGTANLHKHHPPRALFDLSKQLYRQGKYEDALEAVSAAVKATDGQCDVDILDRRAAIYSHLKNYKAALADGRAIIDHDEASPLGYLRLGKILQLMDKPQRAQQMYQRGLRFCKPNQHHPKYVVLQQHSQELSIATSAVDFVSLLPAELLQLIFSYLPFRTQLLTLKVCKTWRTRIADSALLWTTVDFSDTKKPVRPQDVQDAVSRAQGRLASLVLKGVGLQGNRLLETLVKKSPGLDSLTILSGGLLQDSLNKALPLARSLRCLRLGGRVDVTHETARRVLVQCPALVEYGLYGVLHGAGPNEDGSASSAQGLQTLHIDITELGAAVFRTSTLLSQGPALRDLRVTARGMQTRIAVSELLMQAPILTKLHLEGGWVMRPLDPIIAVLGEQLTSLTLVNTGKLKWQDPDLIHYVALRDHQAYQRRPLLWRLKELRLNETAGQVHPGFVREVVWAGPEGEGEGEKEKTVQMIHSLDVGAALHDSEQLVALLSQRRLEQVQVLKLSGCPELTDEHAGVIASKLKQVRQLELDQSSVTGVGVKAVVQGLGQLHSLSLIDCCKVRRDAVEWAELQGVKVQFWQRQEPSASAIWRGAR